MDIEVNILNAFTYNGRGGNPAGVVLNADKLKQSEKQQIAASINMSETAFVSKSLTADYKFEFFTPSKQIAHCGHATIATFSYLKQINEIKDKISSKETIDGIRSIYFEGDCAYMEQTAPSYTSVTEDIDSILHVLGLGRKDLANGQDPIIANTGNSFLLVAVGSEAILKQLQPDFSEIARLSEKYGLIGFYPFTTSVEDNGFDATTRMFAPYYGIDEEAATGMAAGPLACYLRRSGIEKTDIRIEQGKFMARPSRSLLNVILNEKDNKIVSLYVGGSATYEEKIRLFVERPIEICD
jgi:PhzF family phenazine biosynthesis protein